MKKILAGGALMALALAGLVATATPASAHTPKATADCTSLSVNLTLYRQSNGKVNTATITVDGKTVVEATPFGEKLVKTYTWADLGIDPASVKYWEVKVDAWDGHNGTQYDAKVSGGPIRGCKTTPPATPDPKPASPDAPVVSCEITTVDAIAEPADSAAIAYTKDATGITAKLHEGYAWGELGGYTKTGDTTAVYSAAALAELIKTQQCATPEPTTEPAPEPTPEPTPEETATPTPAPTASEVAAVTPTPSASAAAAPVLAATGAQIGGAVAFALLLVGGGFGLFWARKRIAQN